ncbi:MAG: CRTAC1 family protein [Terriglobia bacterium]
MPKANSKSWKGFSCGLGAALAAACLVALLRQASPANVRPGATPPPTVVQFTDVTKASGIDFVHFKGNNGTSTILEEAGPGVCAADYDGDGYVDFYIVSGRDLYNRGLSARNALFHNNGDGTFTDVTQKAGVPGTAYGLGCVWGDYDNDGFPDLYVTQYGKNILYHNNRDGTFTDVTDKAGVGATEFGTTFHTGATFFDYDHDGRLDLYVGGYCNFLPTSQRYCEIGPGVLSSCRPTIYGGSADYLYHNNGDGTFTNVTKAAKVYNPDGINLAALAGDYDNDGWPDLFVSNDGIQAYLYHNQHDGTFESMGMMSGMALSGEGNEMAAMCLSLGDYDHDGFMDLYVSDFQMVGDHLFHNNGKGFFDEVSSEAGIAQPTKSVLSFGGGFLDYDNDGWLDLFIANGSVYPEIELISSEIWYKQINSLFHNDGNGRFTEVSKLSGSGFSKPHTGRGVAFADFDNDGNIDVVVGNDGEPPLLLHNGGAPGNHFLTLKLIGTRSNRDAMGARVKLRAGGMTQIGEVMGGGSYLSQSDLRLHFGLGGSARAEQVEVVWPSGLRQVFPNVPADKFYEIEEGKDQLRLQNFVRHRIGQ